MTFLFPGQGSQHVYMGRELYSEEPVFRSEIDNCAELLKPHLGRDLRELLFPTPDTEKEAEETLRNTQFAQPAIFAVSYALAKLWMSLGVTPAASLGHSIGEFVSACIAEVFSLEDALRAVAARGRLMQSMPTGSMLAVMASGRSRSSRCCRPRSRSPPSTRRWPVSHRVQPTQLRRWKRNSRRMVSPRPRSTPRMPFTQA